MIPGVAFARVPVSVEARPGMIGYNKDFLNWIISGGKFKRLETIQPLIPCDYTVTIRNHKRAICRNSNAPVWRQFAKEIGAIVIEDELDEPISLHYRMALYAGAIMNFGVCNGPTAMIGLTSYPLRQFIPNDSARNSVIKSWIALETECCPWMLPNQRLVWAEETIENMYRSMSRLICLKRYSHTPNQIRRDLRLWLIL